MTSRGCTWVLGDGQTEELLAAAVGLVLAPQLVEARLVDAETIRRLAWLDAVNHRAPGGHHSTHMIKRTNRKSI